VAGRAQARLDPFGVSAGAFCGVAWLEPDLAPGRIASRDGGGEREVEVPFPMGATLWWNGSTGVASARFVAGRPKRSLWLDGSTLCVASSHPFVRSDADADALARLLLARVLGMRRRQQQLGAAGELALIEQLISI
jgi:hypothetical protein